MRVVLVIKYLMFVMLVVVVPSYCTYLYIRANDSSHSNKNHHGGLPIAAGNKEYEYCTKYQSNNNNNY